MGRMNVQQWMKWVVVVGVVLMAIGCGRSSLHGDCTSDEECGEGLACEGGVCVPEDEAVNVAECTSDEDCGEPVCRIGETGGCVGDVCNEETGQCEIAGCDPGCGEDEYQDGCICIPEECDDDDDCQGQICADGMCRPCASDAECSDDGSKVCSGGFCEPNVECVDDDDCRTHERCEGDSCVLRPDCTFDDDCDEDERCVGGVCTYTPECEDDDDCGSQAECVGGYCQADVCRGNDECPDDELCDGGECVPPPIALSCEVVTPSQTITPGEQVELNAFAYDQQGNGVAATFSWESSNESVAEIQGNELVGGDSSGTTTVTATLQGGDPVSCDGSPTFNNPGPPPVDEIRVGVRHMETGEPIENAEVFIDGVSELTDGAGFADLPDPTDDAGVDDYKVSVFHDDYNYVTVKGVESDDIRIPVSPRSGTGPVAGFTGQFDTAAIHTSGDIELGMAGASIAGDLLDLNLERLFGDPFYTEFELFGFGAGEVPMPGGVTAHGEIFGSQLDGKQTYYVQSAGGPRLAWGIAGQVDPDELLDLVTSPPDDIVSAIGMVLPLFSRFDHAQQSKVLDAKPRVLDVQDINNSGNTNEWLPDYDAFPEEDLMPSVRQDLTTEVDISALPQFNGEQAEVAVLLGGTRAGDLGVVPLGISAIADEDGTGQPDSQTLYMAPPYGSAVGGRYNVIAIAIDADPGAEGAVGNDLSMALWNGQTLATEISMGTFPDSSTGWVNDGAREVEVDDASAGPIFRVRLIDQERSWDVWKKDDSGVAGQFSTVIEVPSSPAGWSDPFADGEEVFVDAISTSVTIDDLVQSGGVGLHRVGLVTTSFNRTTLE